MSTAKKTFELSLAYPSGAGPARVLSASVSTDAELRELIRDFGGGALVLADTSVAIRSVAALVEGGSYGLVGGSQESLGQLGAGGCLWDRYDLERATTKAARDAFSAILGADAKMGTNETVYGREFKDRQLIHGLLTNATVAIVLEVHPSAHPDHIDAVLAKAAFIKGKDEKEQNTFSPRFERYFVPCKHVVPVVGSAHFSDAMLQLCDLRGVGVVAPSLTRRGGFEFRPSAHAAHGLAIDFRPLPPAAHGEASIFHFFTNVKRLFRK